MVCGSHFNTETSISSLLKNREMSIQVNQPFGLFLFQCFEEYRREFVPNGKLSPQLWQEKADEFHAAWHRFHDKKPVKRKTVVKTDEEWISELEADPVNSGLNVRQELGKAEFWCRENHRICTRRFFTNWLLKAERKVGGQGGSSMGSPPPRKPLPGPDLSQYREMTDEEREQANALLMQWANRS
jgi:hypothetical protein